MDQIWNAIAPYVAAVGGAAGFGAIVWGFVVLFAKKFINKSGDLLEQKFNTDRIASAVAKALAGKTLNIDVTAVTEKALKRTASALDERVVRVEETVASLRLILIAIAKGVARFKALSEEEKMEILNAIAALEGQSEPPKQEEVMTVMLEPVSLSEEPEEDGIVGANFGDLEG